MNANRLINMAINLLMRHGMKRLNKGQKTDPRAKQAQKSLKVMRRAGRL